MTLAIKVVKIDLKIIISQSKSVKQTVEQGSQTHIGHGATFERKMLRGPQFIRRKLLLAAIYKKSPQNKPNLIKFYTLVIF